jgi:hypothetical protein
LESYSWGVKFYVAVPRLGCGYDPEFGGCSKLLKKENGSMRSAFEKDLPDDCVTYRVEERQ